MLDDRQNTPSMSADSIDVERCIAELQRGRAIILRDSNSRQNLSSPALQVVRAVEGLADSEIQDLLELHNCSLALSRSRALALNLLVDSAAVCLQLTPQTTAETVRIWSGLVPGVNNARKADCSCGREHDSAVSHNVTANVLTGNLRSAKAALNLARHAHVLPAFIIYPIAEKPEGLLCVSTEAADQYADHSGELVQLSSAKIPLATASNVELTVFREKHGNAEHVAIKVGDPDLSGAVTVRLHSSCFTGDILGSMKCDCGEQLQRAITSMEAADGGIVLYVSQEGRGIGLSSKLLAYQLQDQGMDTIDANRHLGFDADERNYAAAVSMLDALGIGDVKLMTNNPLKIEALRRHGVNVHDRVPSPATENQHNARYLETKRKRAGHYSNLETVG